MSIESNKEIKVGMVAWGLKNGYQIFFNSPHIDVKSTEIRRTLEDVRVLVNFTSVDLKFYSLEWTEDYKVFTSYLALYDWSNRKNAYLAMSLFVPHDQRMSDGALGLVDQLTETYRDKYIGEDFKIKRVNEDEAHFFGLVSSAPILPDAKRKRPNRPQNAGYGLVRYQNEEDLKGFFKNSYLKEYEDYKEIFFLPAEQNRLNPSSVIKPVTTKDGQPLTPQPLSFPVSVKPVIPGLTGPVETSKLVVKMNGLTTFPDDEGVYTREFSGEKDQIKVEITYGEDYLPRAESRQVMNWGTGATPISLEKKPPPPPKPVYKPEPKHRGGKKGNGKQGSQQGDQQDNGKKIMDFGGGEAASGAAGSLPENSKIWSKENRIINGVFTLEIYLKDNETKHAISTTQGKHVKLNVTNLGGAFYSSSPVIRLTGLSVGDVLEGLIEADGYRTKTFNYTVRPAAGSAISVLEPQTVFLDRVINPTAAAGGAGAAGTRPKDNGGDSSEGLAQWMKILIAVLIAIMVCALAYLAYDFLTKPDGGIKEEEKEVLLAEFKTRYDEKQKELATLSDQHLSILQTFEGKVAEAEGKEIRKTLIDSARNAYQESLDYFKVSDKLLEPAKQMAEYMVDTSKVKLPTINKLDSLFNKPFETFKSRKGRDTKTIVDLENLLANALDNKSTVETETERRKRELQENARTAEGVANEANLYTEGIYRKYIKWCTQGSTNNTDFSTSQARNKVLDKLELMKKIASLDYLARTDLKQAPASVMELKALKKDNRLTTGQKKMVQEKIDFAMANPPS